MSVIANSEDIEKLRSWGRDHLWMQGERASDLQARGQYQIVARAEGCYIYDLDGNRYIDGNASGFVKFIGHGRVEIARAVAAQMAQLSYTPNVFGQTTVPAITLARKLAELAPGTLSRTFFCTGGSDAIEVALQLARQVHHIRGKTRKFKVISRRPEYHGSTYAAMSLGSRNDRNNAIFEPLMPGVLQVDAPNCTRCPWGLGRPNECCGLGVTSLRQLIEGEGADTIAALVATPMRVGGALPPDGYWPAVRRLCTENDILLIADEVTVGFGRLGTWFGMQRFGITPDIMALGKGLTSGELPVGAAMATQEIAEAFDGARGSLGQFAHGTTFGGHPVVMAAALENIRIMESEGLIENSASMGRHLHQRLLEMASRHACIDSVTGGLGLLATISVVGNRKTGARYPGGSNGPAMARLAALVRKRGLSIKVGNTINIAPPLVIGRALVDEIVQILDDSLTDMEREFPCDA